MTGSGTSLCDGFDDSDIHVRYCSVVASSKDVYQLRFYNIQAGDDEEED